MLKLWSSHCRMTKIACLDRPCHLSQGLVCPGACHRLANPARRNRCRRTKCKWCWASFWTYLIWLDVTRFDENWCCLMLVIIGQYYITNWTHEFFLKVDATEETSSRRQNLRFGDLKQRSQGWTIPDIVSMNGHLVGGIPTPLKNMKVNGKDYPIYYGK